MEIFDFFNEKLEFCRLTNNKREIIIRCPYCGDSSDKHHGHFYIKNVEPFPSYCHRCNFRASYLSSTLLKDLNIYNNNLINYSQELKKNSGFIKNIKEIDNDINFKYNLDISQKITKKHNKRIEYLRNRFNYNFELEELLNLKIIFDLESIFVNNKLNKYYNIDKRFQKLLIELNENCIGFLSFDNGNIIFRNINKDAPFRYYFYNLFNNYDDSKNFYTIPNKINVLEPSDLYLTEGTFDILGIYLKLDKKIENNIFSTANGKYYKKTILTFYRLGFIDGEIHIFSDNDVNKTYFNYLRKEIFNQHINLYYNTDEKDFGIAKDKIHLIHSKI